MSGIEGPSCGLATLFVNACSSSLWVSPFVLWHSHGTHLELRTDNLRNSKGHEVRDTECVQGSVVSCGGHVVAPRYPHHSNEKEIPLKHYKPTTEFLIAAAKQLTSKQKLKLKNTTQTAQTTQKAPHPFVVPPAGFSEVVLLPERSRQKGRFELF